MKNKYTLNRVIKLNAIIAGTLLFGFVANAQTMFTPGNIVVSVIGNGTTTGSVAVPVQLVEYNASGATGFSVAIPTSNTSRLTQSYSAGSEGQVTLSAERDRVIVAGYDASVGTNSVASAANINRTIDAVTPSGVVTRVGYATQASAYSANNIRSATSAGALYFGSGTASSTALTTGGILSFSQGTATQIEPGATNTRVVNVFNGRLYFSSMSSPFYGIYAVGTSVQGTTGQAIDTIIKMSSTASPYAFYFSPDGNTCYVADDRSKATGGGILKFIKSAGVFPSTPAYTLYAGATKGATGVTVDFSGTNPVIYAVNTSDSLVRIVDMGSAAASPYTTVAVAATNYHFKSVVAAPTGRWTGATSTDFATASNWYSGIVPAAFTEVTVPAVTNQPIIAANTTISALSLLTSAAITINTGDTLFVTNFLNDSSSVNGAGVLALTGIADQAITGSGGINNLMLNNGVSATITSGSSIFLKGILSLTNGAFIANGGLTLLNNGSTTARIPAIGVNGSLAGNINIQQYIPGKRAFRFLSHPYSSSIALSQLTSSIDITGTGGSANGFTGTATNNPSAFWYNPVTGNGSASNDSTGWIAFTSTNGSGNNAWNASEGIRVLVRGTAGQGLNGAAYTPNDVILTTQGSINQGTVIQTMHKGTNSAYNVLGNPYPSPTDIGTVIGNNSASLSGSGYYVWNANMQTAGAYEVKPVSGGAYYLPQNTAYVVVTAADGNTLTYNEINKASTASESLQKATVNNSYITIGIYDSTANLWDKLYIQSQAQASDNKDDFDAAKLYNTALNFYTLSADNQGLSIDSRPFTNNTVIPLGLTTSEKQVYTLKADNFTLPAGMQLYLVDNYLGVNQLLQQGSNYNFTVNADTASQGNRRFELTVAQPTAINNIQNTNMSVTVYPNPAENILNLHYVNAAQNDASVYITNLVGQALFNKKVALNQSGDMSLNISSLPAGTYIVQFVSGKYTINKKLIKQ